MNCQLCKYRTQIIGYEGDAGAPQVPHHHQMRGSGMDGDHSHHHHR
jgi:sirohydrochlorin cobaltochelatase